MAQMFRDGKLLQQSPALNDPHALADHYIQNISSGEKARYCIVDQDRKYSGGDDVRKLQRR